MRATFVLLLLSFGSTLIAQPLKIVTVSAPAINKVFDPSGVLTVKDRSSAIATKGFLQSRYFHGTSPFAGYEFRVDLRQLPAGTKAITKLTVRFTPNIPVDFNGDGQLDDVFVITSGGLGSVTLASAVRNGTDITFTFAGKGVTAGTSSFFFGLAAKYAPKPNGAQIIATAVPPPDLKLLGWAPIEVAPPKP